MSEILVACFVVDSVLLVVILMIMQAINDKWGKKELGGGWFILAVMISGALTSAIFLYYLFTTWTIS